MTEYNINKGIGRTVEFKGLKAQYLFIFAGGLLSTLILIMILYMTGVNSYVCLALGAAASSILIWKTFSLNKKYGEHGLMKLGAKKKHPRYIISRKAIHRYLQTNHKSGIA
ncbi:conjugal transfer protein TraF [Elizabethkingia anophelis]|uniref:Conjugal transfer protein TraF n=1 Tax=Elizabethkingia anophelis TaxID=1117645 RepID=A0AAE4T3I8_9FLAO|nr:conjugal transfer protein TraF [Elizabethkingia anophelis]